MDIQGANSGPNSTRKAYEQRQNALIDANRALVRAARDVLSKPVEPSLTDATRATAERTDGSGASHRDSIELSSAAQAVNEPSAAEREARVRELAEAHRQDSLNTSQRIERAAQSLLGG